MTLKMKRMPAHEIIEEAACDKCGKSLMSIGVCHDLHYAVLEPSFGYDSGLDMIHEGPNGMRLYFCENCYKAILQAIGLEIGCNPEDGYHWKELDPELLITVGDGPTETASTAANVRPAKVKINAWKHLDKRVAK